ncbi:MULTISPECIES: S-layer homology domain-containing protein [unclassified Paenibacillus]|uniref:S-layer homology domain-containing protein n=1 Tax=unclassified Paenibacillus TaxID=185978 RepID=UPI003625AB76
MVAWCGTASAETAAVEKRSFPDLTESHWSYEAVQKMAAKQIIEGYQDGTFQPSRTLTRAEFASLLYKAAQLSGTDSSASSVSVFRDVDKAAWYKPFAEALKNVFVQNQAQSEPGLFAPDSPALREDVAAAIVRIKKWSSSEQMQLKDRFKDVDSVAPSAFRDLEIAVEKGILSGFEDGTVRAKSALTRAEAAVMLAKAFPQDAPLPAADAPSKTDSQAQSAADTLTHKGAIKPLYAIVDTLADDIAVTYSKDSGSSNSKGTRINHEFNDLKLDAQNNIYFIQTEYYRGTPMPTVRSLDKNGGAISTFKFSDTFNISGTDKVNANTKEQKPFVDGMVPVKLLLSSNQKDLQLAANWNVPDFVSIQSLTGSTGKLVAQADKGSSIAAQDFIIQLQDGDYIFSNSKKGYIGRFGSNGPKVDWTINIAFSGKPLTALVKDSGLYILDQGTMVLMKIDMNTKQIISKVFVKADNIKFATVREDRFYISQGKSISTLDQEGKLEPFIDDGNQFVYNGLKLMYPVALDPVSLYSIKEFTSFTFDSSGNLIFYDEELRNIRRLRFITNEDFKYVPLPSIIPVGPKLKVPEAEILIKHGLYNEKTSGRIQQLITDEHGNIWIKTEDQMIKIWSYDTKAWKDLSPYPTFVYEDEKQPPTLVKTADNPDGIYFDERNNYVLTSSWSKDIRLAIINQIVPDILAVGFMKDREALTEHDFVVSDGRGHMAVSDVKQGNLWIIGRDRQGVLASPSEVGNHIRFSGGATAAIWDSNKLTILDVGSKQLTQVELNSTQYKSSVKALSIPDAIDSICAYGEKFYVISGKTLYHIDVNGNILLKEDLFMHIKDKTRIVKMSMESNGRLVVIDKDGAIQRIQFYGK